MAKKIIMINGSARKQNTFGMLKDLKDIFVGYGINVEIVHLHEININHCVGCEHCVKKEGCSQMDDMESLMRRIQKSDGLVLGTPIYMNGPSSLLKAFCDRLNEWVHKPMMASKPIMMAATTASSGAKELKKFFFSFAAALGARRGDFVYRSNKNMGTLVQGKEIAGFLSLIADRRRDYKPALDELIMFEVGKAIAIKSTGHDNKYWASKGLFNEKYYYLVRINPFKQILVSFIAARIRKNI